MKNRVLIKKMVLISLFSGVTVILYYLGSILPLSIAFLDIQFSSLPILIGSVFLGPVEGIVITIVRFLLKVFLIGTKTAGVGEVADVIIALGMILGLYLTKRFYKGRAKTLVMMLGSIFGWVLFALLSNCFILAPWYIKVSFDNDVSGFVEFLAKYLTGINESNYLLYYLFGLILPFNLLLSTIISTVSFISYKRIKLSLKEGDENA